MVRRRTGKNKSEDYYDEEEMSGPDDNTPYNIPEKYQRIDAERFDITVRELWDRYTNNNITLQPSFQRNYVWDEKKASRYVESLLLGLPTPPVFVAEETSGQWTVIDGHQRLASLFRFMKVLVSSSAQVRGVPVPWASLTPLILQELEVLTSMMNKQVTAIPIHEREKRLYQIKIPVVKLGKNTDADMKYVLFERLNLGSLSLNNQELRNCLYRGPYNELLIELSRDNRYLKLWNRKEDDKRMKDRERALRFFVFLHRIEKYAPPLKKFLSDEMKENQNANQLLNRFRSEFYGAISWVERIWGNEAYKQYKMGNEINHKGHWVPSRYDLIYDVEMVGFGQYGNQLTKWWASANEQQQALIRLLLRNRLVGVMTRDTFVASMLEGTWRKQAVSARYDPWLHTLEIITNDYNKAMKEATVLHKALIESNICCYCGTQVPEEEVVLVMVDGKQRVSHIYCQRFQH